MTLNELNPSFSPDNEGGGYLSFDCPVCGPSDRIKNLRVSRTAIKEPYRWLMTGNPGDWDSISIQPSINYKQEHWHGHITNGQILP